MSKRENFTAGLVAKKQCEPGKTQSIFWDGKTPGLGLRVTTGGAKSYIFETRLHGKTIRITIGDVRTWSVGKAQEEATSLKAMTDKGIDPRQVVADAAAAMEAEATARRQTQARETVTVAEAWQAYVKERSESVKDGKPEWGEKHKAHHAYFVQPGGVKRTRGRRPNEPETTRPGVLVPLMGMRLADIDSKVVAAWLEKETAQAPTTAAQAFRAFRAFLAWCAKQEAYKDIARTDACQADDVKKKVPTPRAKQNDSLRRAQIKPWFDAVRKIRNPVISAYLQGLLLTGARRNELATLRWRDVDFQWKSLTIRDKVEGERTIPLTPYLESLIAALPRRNLTAKQIGDTPQGTKTFRTSSCSVAPQPNRDDSKSRAICITGHWPQPHCPRYPSTVCAVPLERSRSGWRFPLESSPRSWDTSRVRLLRSTTYSGSSILLHLWHVKIEKWILEQAGIEQPKAGQPSMMAVSCWSVIPWYLAASPRSLTVSSTRWASGS
jgi:integrase